MLGGLGERLKCDGDLLRLLVMIDDGTARIYYPAKK